MFSIFLDINLKNQCYMNAVTHTGKMERENNLRVHFIVILLPLIY